MARGNGRKRRRKCCRCPSFSVNGKRARVYCLRIDPDELENWKRVARELGLSVSELVRRAVRVYIRKHEETVPYISRRVRVY